VLLYLLAQQQGDPLTSVLPQYGAIGVIALICIYAVYKLFTNLIESHKSEIERIELAHKDAIQRADSAYDKEVSRGDRLENELRDLNRLINDKLAGELVRATDAIREAFETMHEQRRRL
jgi:dsDNA-specific endonuclease/ATPase MutS2